MKILFLWERDSQRGICADSERSAVRHSICAWSTLFSSVPIAGTSCLPHPAEVCADSRIRTDVANIQYTSGTTGQPKGVMLTHRNQVNNGKMLASAVCATPKRDRICVPLPLYHCFGCVIGTMSALASGAAMILPNWTFDPRATLQAVQAERVTSLYGVPAMFIAELGLPDFKSYDLSSLRTGMMAGAPCPVEVMKRVICDMGCAELTIGYGQTESTPVVTMSATDDPVELRVSTIGKALPCTEMKIVSVLDGHTVPARRAGRSLRPGLHGNEGI